MNGRERFAQDLAALVPAGSVPLLIVRRGGCGCRIAAVYRVGGRLVMAGQSRNLIETGGRRVVELTPFLIPDLEAPGEPQGHGCRHSAGQVLDLATIAAKAREATRPRTTLTI